MTARDLGPHISEAPSDFEFFQLVRLLTRLAPFREPVGRFAAPGEESVRFGGEPELSFPPTEVRGLELEVAEGPPRMGVHFFGLIGALGVLPTQYTELVRERERNGDRAMGEFFNLFHHRMLSLFVRAWERSRPGVAFERGEEDAFGRILMSLVGLGTPGLAGRQAVKDQALVYYAGLLSQMPRSSSALEQIISEYFDVDCEVIPFAGAWRPIEKEAQTRFRDRPRDSESLGRGAVVGDEVWDQQSVFRLRLGPLPLKQYSQFLPGASAYKPLGALVKFFCGEDLDAEVQLVLRREEAPRAGLDVEDGPPPQLGWVSWMFSKPLDRDPDETVLRLWAP
ncbi:MAG: type VI secretion system baseplate subunit TssG [Bryobacterales bacterium]|nr:type VI secretion system baseplate subunit TssG [Bryobacterales bacterium]